MNYFIIPFLVLAGLANASVGTSGEPGTSFLFHGVATIIQPNFTTEHPADNILEGANFYSYSSAAGYLSFGWWLPPKPDTNYTHCTPDSSTYMWYEYSDKFYGCDKTGCKAHVKNYLVSNITEPSFSTNYTFTTASLGAPELGQLGVSWFDRKRGASAVGTRHSLSESADTTSDCCKALRTMQSLKKKFEVPIQFELIDICRQATPSYANPLVHWGQARLGSTCGSLEEL